MSPALHPITRLGGLQDGLQGIFACACLSDLDLSRVRIQEPRHFQGQSYEAPELLNMMLSIDEHQVIAWGWEADTAAASGA